MDFSKLEEMEQIAKQEELKAQASKELDDLLSGRTTSAYRNVAVDRSSQALKDDRFKNPNQVYDEARELQRKLDASRAAALREQQGEDAVATNNNNLPDSNAPQYKGPSVISYSLDGRKAMSLPVPAYKCPGGGDVSIQITVNRKGYVTAAAVIGNVVDECIVKSAIAAAKKSRFRASSTAPEKQIGEIVYRFIAQ